MNIKILLVLILAMVSCKQKVANGSEAEKVFQLCRSIDLSARKSGITGENIIYGKWSVGDDAAIIFVGPDVPTDSTRKMREIIEEESKKVNFKVKIL